MPSVFYLAQLRCRYSLKLEPVATGLDTMILEKVYSLIMTFPFFGSTFNF